MISFFLRAATLALLVVTGAAQAQPPQFFYCYVPNAENGTVYMTQALPLGPVSERARYGEDYAAYLRGEGLVSATAKGYCTMRATTGEIAKAREEIQSGYCPECNGANRFTTAPWPRPGAEAQREPLTAESAIRQVVPQPHQQTVPLAPDDRPDPRVVVMANEITGEVLVVPGPNAEKAAEQATANSFPSVGWSKLASTEESGYGIALCVDGPPIAFFVAHGKENLAEAFAEAIRQAKPYALQHGKKPRLCEHWRIAAPGEVHPAWDASIIDQMKELVLHISNEYLACTESEESCMSRVRKRFPGTGMGVRG